MSRRRTRGKAPESQPLRHFFSSSSQNLSGVEGLDLCVWHHSPENSVPKRPGSLQTELIAWKLWLGDYNL